MCFNLSCHPCLQRSTVMRGWKRMMTVWGLSSVMCNFKTVGNTNATVERKDQRVILLLWQDVSWLHCMLDGIIFFTVYLRQETLNHILDSLWSVQMALTRTGSLKWLHIMHMGPLHQSSSLPSLLPLWHVAQCFETPGIWRSLCGVFNQGYTRTVPYNVLYIITHWALTHITGIVLFIGMRAFILAWGLIVFGVAFCWGMFTCFCLT